MLPRMSDASVIEWIREKYTAIVGDLDERGRRRWAAAEARSLGWGGVTAVAFATGLSDRTIRTGIKELHNPDATPANRQRKIVPYGVYDITNNEAGVSVGISHDTAEFAVSAIRRWWQELGRQRFPKARRLLITADSGGSNSPRTRLWRWALQQFADETGLTIELCHYPPGTSKWNKIEHRLFCHITRNWQGIQGQRTLSRWYAKDFEKEVPAPSAFSAFHCKAGLQRVLLEQRQCEPPNPAFVLGSTAMTSS